MKIQSHELNPTDRVFHLLETRLKKKHVKHARSEERCRTDLEIQSLRAQKHLIECKGFVTKYQYVDFIQFLFICQIAFGCIKRAAAQYGCNHP